MDDLEIPTPIKIDNQDTEDQEPSYRTKYKFSWLNPYISEAGALNMSQHKYSGSDLGLAYIYFYDPVARYLTSKLPDYIAPNTLTLFGFVHTLIPLYVMWLYSGMSLVGELPSWFVFL